MATFNYPFHVTKDTPAVAGEVQTNFDALLAWVLANLVQRDGTLAMTGPLVLAPGDPAAPEHAANKAYVDSVIPVGTIWEYAGTALPAGWLWCNGDTYSNTSQPALSAAIGRTYTDAGVPAGSFQVPDKRKRVSVGADASETMFNLGKTGGQRNSELLTHTHQVPAHGHTLSGGISNSNADHTHGFSTSGASHGSFRAPRQYLSYGTGLYGIPYDPNADGLVIASGGTGAGSTSFGSCMAVGDGAEMDHTHSGSTGGASGAANHGHGHTLAVNNQAAFDTVAQGAGTALTDKNLQPFLATNFIIYAGA